MDNRQPGMGSAQSGSRFSNSMVVGIALVTVGGVVWAFGTGVSGAAMIRGFRAWLYAQQQRVSDSVQHQTIPAKAASSVRGNSMRKEMATSSAGR
jgi:hypothetical protein